MATSFFSSRLLPIGRTTTRITPRASTATTLTLGLAGATTVTFLPRPTFLHCQSDAAANDPSSPLSWLGIKPFWRKTPLPPPPPPERPTALQATCNPMYYRQISSGSFLGLVCGIVVARWSGVLVVLVGAVLFVVQFLELKGINIIPYQRIQRLIGDRWDLKRAMTENVAFKVAFGASFILAALQST